VTGAEDRLAAAHRLLLDGLGRLVSGEDWRRYLELSARFHQYSPLNVVLLMAQGAEGRVAGYHTWRTIPARDGGRCQVANGAHGHRVLAPVIRKRAAESPDEDSVVITRLVGFKAVVVFDETHLVCPPAIPEPAPPTLLEGVGPAGFSRAVAAAIAERGYRLEVDPGIAPANGRADFVARTVALRPGLSEAQVAKTLAHELAHLDRHAPGQAGVDLPRPVKEIEAESVAWLLARAAGLDAGGYSFAYLAHWAGGDLPLVASTAHRAVSCARRLSAELDGRPDHLALPSLHSVTIGPTAGVWPALAPGDVADNGVRPRAPERVV
jgi:hypothetical protein